MSKHYLFLTGKLAEKSLHKVLESMQPTGFSYEVRQMGVSVAALMTTDLIARRLTDVSGFDKILLPGRCRGDIDALASNYGIEVETWSGRTERLATTFWPSRQANRFESIFNFNFRRNR